MEKKEDAKSFSFPVGMRIVKTAIAALLCMVIDFLRGQIPFQSVVTTAMCIQPDRENSVKSAISRALGTIVGSAFGFFVLLTFSKSVGEIHTLFYYLLVAVFMIPMIFVVNKIKMPGGVIVSIVVYMSITMVHTTTAGSWSYAFNRIIDTFVGIFVALPVNLLLHKKEDTVDNFSRFLK